MADKRKVIEGLKRCKPAWFTTFNCRDEECPYNVYGHECDGCVDHLIGDTLELLDGYPRTVLYREDGEYCPSCSTVTDRVMGIRKLQRGTNYCPYCGTAVTWNG